jgi:hypothetical protein
MGKRWCLGADYRGLTQSRSDQSGRRRSWLLKTFRFCRDTSQWLEPILHCDSNRQGVVHICGDRGWIISVRAKASVHSCVQARCLSWLRLFWPPQSHLGIIELCQNLILESLNLTSACFKKESGCSHIDCEQSGYWTGNNSSCCQWRPPSHVPFPLRDDRRTS